MPLDQSISSNLYSVVTAVASLMLGLASYRQSSQARKTAKDSKELETTITTAITLFEARITEKLALTYVNKEGVAQISRDVAEAIGAKNFMHKDLIMQQHLAIENRFALVDKTMEGINHRIKRNSDQVTMVMGVMFDLMAHVGMRRPKESAHILTTDSDSG